MINFNQINGTIFNKIDKKIMLTSKKIWVNTNRSENWLIVIFINNKKTSINCTDNFAIKLYQINLT